MASRSVNGPDERDGAECQASTGAVISCAPNDIAGTIAKAPRRWRNRRSSTGVDGDETEHGEQRKLHGRILEHGRPADQQHQGRGGEQRQAIRAE